MWGGYCDDFTKELIGSLAALGKAKLTKVAYFCSLKGKIDSQNLPKNLLLEQNFLFHLLSVKLGGW